MSVELEQARAELRELGRQVQAAAVRHAPVTVLDPLLAEMRVRHLGIERHHAAALGTARPVVPRIPGPVRVRRLVRAA